SLLAVGPSAIYLVGLGVCYLSGDWSPTAVLLAQQLAIVLCVLPLVAALKPRLHSFRQWWEAAGLENRGYGWPTYVGSLAGVASEQVNRLAIAFWLDNTAVGYYGLAMNLTQPLKLIPAAVATSFFREFARVSRMPPKVLALTAGACVGSLPLALVAFGSPLEVVYSRGFSGVGPMAQVAAFGAVLFGLGDLFNRFLGAHGEGRTLRDVAFLVGAVNSGGFFLLVPFWGAWGAVATAVAAGAVYLLFMLVSYNRRHLGLAATVRGPEEEAHCP
ncbi:MAG: hypothetical protein M0Z94_16510, partial [Dehalococcoidales bacterium]|nr:hypothetical protein [Dehalococcoidales bacterium]